MKYKLYNVPNDTAWERKTIWYYLYKINFPSFLHNSIRNFVHGVQNLYKWFYIIWNDRNFDHSYIYKILEHKLLLQRNYLVYYNRTEKTDEINGVCTEILNLIDLAINKEFYEHRDKVEKKYKFVGFESVGHPKGCYIMESKFEVPLTEEETKQYRKDYKEAILLDIEEEKKVKDRLFQLLRENIDLLWD